MDTRNPAHLYRVVCTCGNLLKSEPQLACLPPQTVHTVGLCCADNLPESMRGGLLPASGRQDEREIPRGF
jgi:hypothetical protein